MKKSTKFVLFTGILATTATIAMAISNKIIDASATLKNLLHGNSKQFYSWKLGKIHYTVRGAGSPVLLIHDLHPCFSSIEWKNIIDTLAKSHKVYAIDLLGCGCSSRPNITYTNYVYVQLLTDFITSVIQKPTDVITSGLSGSLAVMTAKNDTSVINKIVMINPHDLADLNKSPDFISKLYKKIIEIPVVGSFIYNIQMSRSNIDLMFTERLLHNPFYVDHELVDSFYEASHLEHGSGKYLYASLKGKYLNFNITKALKEIPNPIYILEGEKLLHSKELIALYQSINKNIIREIISHSKKLPQTENSNIIIEQLANIL